MQSRREFIKNTCTVCLGTTVLGVSLSQLTSCASLPIYKTALSGNLVKVPASSFTASNLLIIRDMQMPYDILLVKKSASEYLALYMKCTHQENPVTATADGFYCSSHGSRFDLDGNVLKEPALVPLKRFPTTIDGDQITISLNS